MPRYDYVSMGFYTYDCLGWPFTEVPPGGGTVFIDELTLAVSGAAGTAAIAAAKMGLSTLAVSGVGEDLMGDWVLQRLQHFGVDTWGVQHQPGWKTSSSIVTTRADGAFHFAALEKAPGALRLVPHQATVLQKLLIRHDGVEYTGWRHTKNSYQANSELGGKPVKLVCELSSEPDFEGKHYGICREG